MKTTNNNDFEYSIKIPVPLGERVWTFWTDCCHACYSQKKEDRPACIQCIRSAPCHTLKHAIQSKVLTFNNLQAVLDGWGVFYFKTSREAEDAGNKRVEENIKKMRELGYDIDDQGRSHGMRNAKSAWEFDNRFNDKKID